MIKREIRCRQVILVGSTDVQILRRSNSSWPWMVQTQLVACKINWEIISPEKNPDSFRSTLPANPVTLQPASRRSPKWCGVVHQIKWVTRRRKPLCNAYLPKLNSGARTLFRYPLTSVALILIDPWLWDPSPWNQERHVSRASGVLISNYIPCLMVGHQIQAIRLRDIILTIYGMCISTL